MKKWPRSRSEGCPRADAWSGAIEYTYTEVSKLDKFEAHGVVHIMDGRAKWTGLAMRQEDHSAKGCPSVYTASASGEGRMELMTIDYTSEKPVTGFKMPTVLPNGKLDTSGPPPPDSKVMLTIFPDQYALAFELPLHGSGRNAGGGPACPGYKSNPQRFDYTLHDNADKKFDIDNPDSLSGTKTQTLFPGATMTMKWKFDRLEEYR